MHLVKAKSGLSFNSSLINHQLGWCQAWINADYHKIGGVPPGFGGMPPGFGGFGGMPPGFGGMGGGMPPGFGGMGGGMPNPQMM